MSSCPSPVPWLTSSTTAGYSKPHPTWIWWGIHNFCGQPVPVFHYPHKKISHVRCIFILLQVKSPLSCNYISLWKVSLALSCRLPSLLQTEKSQTEQFQFFCLFPQERCSSSQIIYVAPLWTCSNRPMSFLCKGSQNWTQHPGGGLTRAKQRDRIPSLNCWSQSFLSSPVDNWLSGLQVHIDGSYFIFTLLISCK